MLFLLLLLECDESLADERRRGWLRARFELDEIVERKNFFDLLEFAALVKLEKFLLVKFLLLLRREEFLDDSSIVRVFLVLSLVAFRLVRWLADDTLKWFQNFNEFVWVSDA